MENKPEIGSNFDSNDYTQEDFDHDWFKYNIADTIGSANIRPDEYIVEMERFNKAYADGMRPTHRADERSDFRNVSIYPRFSADEPFELTDQLMPHWHPYMASSQEPTLDAASADASAFEFRPKSALQKRLAEISVSRVAELATETLRRILMDGDTPANPAYWQHQLDVTGKMPTVTYLELQQLLQHPRINELNDGSIELTDFIDSVRTEKGLEPLGDEERSAWNATWGMYRPKHA